MRVVALVEALRFRPALAGLAGIALGLAACGSGAGSSSSTSSRGALRVGHGAREIYRAKLSGAGEATGGAPRGVGAAVIALHGSSVVCWRFAHLHGFVDATAARIETGAKGKPRKVMLLLSNGPRLHHQGCVRVKRAIVNAIRSDPSSYYVNVSSRQYPAGAVRSRL